MDFITDFTPYAGLAVILFAIRQTKRVPNAWIPIVAILLGVPYAFWESGGISPQAVLTGLQYALLGIGTVAGVKYFLQTKSDGQ
jgi:hypothetical protein